MRGPQSLLRKNEDVIFAISEKILSRIKESLSPSKAFYLVSGIWISRHMRKKGQKTMSTKNGSKELHIFLINSYKIVIILKYPFREPEIVQPNSITLMSLIIGLFIIRVLCVATFENINVLVYNKCLGLVCLGNITK